MPITASEGSAAFAAARPDLDDLIKRRFFYRQAFEIYGGVGGFYTYGPPGAAVKQNLIDLWRKHFVIEENLLEVDDTNIMPYDVLHTSGHVERFNDFIVKDAKDPNKFYRADKLLEDVMDARMAAKECTPELKKEYQTVKAQADAYSKDELWGVFQQYQIKSPETGNDLTEPVAFNLMFPVPIGPIGDQSGFLRPETAQGIFLNFKFCLEQHAAQSQWPWRWGALGLPRRAEGLGRACAARIADLAAWRDAAPSAPRPTPPQRRVCPTFLHQERRPDAVRRRAGAPSPWPSCSAPPFFPFHRVPADSLFPRGAGRQGVPQ